MIKGKLETYFTESQIRLSLVKKTKQKISFGIPALFVRLYHTITNNLRGQRTKGREGEVNEREA